MKRLADLTIEDLTAAPVWRYEGGGGCDVVIAAEGRDSLSRTDDEVFLAATEFFLADSSRYLGFCFPADDAGLDYLQPSIVTRGGHVRFWFDGSIARESLSAQWNALGKREDEIFPVRFRCLVPVDGQMVTGVIPGIEISTGVSPALPGEPIACGPHATGSGPHRSQRSDGAVLTAWRGGALRLVAGRAGIVEKRAALRHSAEMFVEFDQGGPRGIGVTGDLSRSGIFIRSARFPGDGPTVSLTVHLPDGRALLLKGKVVRSVTASDSCESSGFGLRLTDKPSEYDDIFSGLLEGLQ